MQPKTIGFTILTLATTFLAVVVVLAQTPPPRLFKPLPEARMQALNVAPPPPAADAATGGIPVKRSRLVELDLPLVNSAAANAFALDMNRPAPSRRIELNLFDDVSVTAVFKRVNVARDDRTILWTGEVEGPRRGSVSLANTGGVVNGKVALADGTIYEIRSVSAAPGIQRIVEMDQKSFPRERAPISPKQALGPPPDLPQALDDGSTVDIMVAYTDAAMQAAGGETAMQQRILQAENDFNTSLAAGDIQFRVRIVHTVKVSYKEAAGFDAALTSLAGKTDGEMDEIHALRDRYGADVVSLWINNPEYCGLGYLMRADSGSFDASAFNVVHWLCTSNYSFAHETGHNMGAEHDRDSAGGQSGYFRYSYGYRQNSRQPYFRTIMAYDCSGAPCPRQNFWSDPDVSYGGMPTGVAVGQALETDNRLTLNQTRFIAARWRNSVPPLITDATPPATRPPAVTDPAKRRSAPRK